MPSTQPPDFTVVFPEAGTAGGVERVAQGLLRFESRIRPTTFVGTVLAGGVADVEHPIAHTVVTPRHAPRFLRPLAFRDAAQQVLCDLRPTTTLTFGVQCPPGDVLWVQSVHGAWLSRGTPVQVRGVQVPAAARRLLARHRVLLGLERRYFTSTRPRLVLCTSQQEVNDLADLYGVDPALTRVVPNGFDGAVFDSGRRDGLRGPLRERIGATDDDIVVLMVANEWHRKGLGVLLDAVAATGDRRFRVDLVGRLAPDGYEAQAQRLGLGDRFHWHGAIDDVSPYYAGADIFALPTAYEPFGIVIAEAMAMGLTVVVPSLAGAAAYVENGVSGLVLNDPRDVDELTGALATLGLASERDRLGAAAPAAVAGLAWHRLLTRVDSLIFPSTQVEPD